METFCLHLIVGIKAESRNLANGRMGTRKLTLWTWQANKTELVSKVYGLNTKVQNRHYKDTRQI